MEGKVFISYSHLNEDWKNRVVSQLKVLSGEGLEVWDDRRIKAGDTWYAEIDAALKGCDIALLLISKEFLTSQFILQEEIPKLLQRRDAEGIRLIPVIIKPCQWTKLPWLSPTQARPTDGAELSGMSEHEAEAALSALAGEVFGLLGALPQAAIPAFGDVDIDHLPKGAERIFGRRVELQLLDAAWAEAGRTTLVELVAPGGVGKTSLVREWLDHMRADGWRGAQQVFGWSFYSQGSSDERQASEDSFLSAALQFFRVNCDPALGPHEKGRHLAETLTRQRALLILDGLEPLQYPPTSPLAGELKAPGVATLLDHLASAGHPGLCLITTRERVADLATFERNEERPLGGLVRCDLSNLSLLDCAHLLHHLGAQRAGDADIGPDDAELIAAGKAVNGHALTLSLLGRYLKLAHGGDVRCRDQVDFGEADAEALNGHAFRAMRAYRIWFEREGENGARALAVLRLLGLFDRPAPPASFAALRADPPIPGLTEALAGLKDSQWNITLTRLAECGLIFDAKPGAPLDTHPLIREFFAAELRKEMEDAWREGHRRLFEQLRNSVPHCPDDEAGLQPLYQAVAHGCAAGLYEEALYDIYVDRILRGANTDGFFSSKRLGLIGANLGAVAHFFSSDGMRPISSLSQTSQGWLLTETGFYFRALGRLGEARELICIGAEIAVKQHDWDYAAASYNNLAELELALGSLALALDAARRSLGYAKRIGDEIRRIVNATKLACVLHQQGKIKAAQAQFIRAEASHFKLRRGHLLLYSVQGFRYCELQLRNVERMAWRIVLGVNGNSGHLENACNAVEMRAKVILSMGEKHDWLLDIGLGHLTLARCALLLAILRGSSPAAATNHAGVALQSLRDSSDQAYIPHGLLTRAWVRHACGDPVGAAADLNEAQRIAARGGMKLHLADIALYRARLFRDRDALLEARRLIEECGYGRRIPELEDAEAALGATR